MGQRRMLHQSHVEGSAFRAASAWCRERRAPDQVRHPVVAEDRDAGGADVANGGLVILDLLVPAGETKHRLVIELGGTFSIPSRRRPWFSQRVRSSTRSRYSQRCAVCGMSMYSQRWMAGSLGRVEHHAVDSELFGKRQPLVRGHRKIADGNAHALFCGGHRILTSSAADRGPEGSRNPMRYCSSIVGAPRAVASRARLPDTFARGANP